MYLVVSLCIFMYLLKSVQKIQKDTCIVLYLLSRFRKILKDTLRYIHICSGARNTFNQCIKMQNTQQYFRKFKYTNTFESVSVQKNQFMILKMKPTTSTGVIKSLCFATQMLIV